LKEEKGGEGWKGGNSIEKPLKDTLYETLERSTKLQHEHDGDVLSEPDLVSGQGPLTT